MGLFSRVKQEKGCRIVLARVWRKCVVDAITKEENCHEALSRVVVKAQ
jgi:hypothetical protein